MSIYNQAYVLLLLAATIFIACEKDAEVELIDQESNEFLCYEFDSGSFMAEFDTEQQPYALMIKSDGKTLDFSTVYMEDYQLINGEEVNPEGEIKLIDLNGNLKLIPQNTKDSYSFQFWKRNFDFTMIPWQTLVLVSKYSEKIFFTGTASVNGASIHTNESKEVNVKDFYFSIKLEGDFAFSTNENLGELPLPMTSITSCPPVWEAN
ncbi:MAG: hypothetical protein AAGJ93_11320 [Bacteroidota bacterium]